MSAKKLDAKEALNATPRSMTYGTSAPADSHNLDKTRKGKRYSEVGHDD